MNYRLFACLVLAICTVWVGRSYEFATKPSDQARPATNESEARSRALMLHEMVSGTLQVIHRDFFDDEESRAIPSASLEDVFQEMEKEFKVKMKWLTVNTDVVNFDHEAKTEFEKSAVRSLTAGKSYFEESSRESYQFAGAIRLGSQCLKCHVKLRSSNEDRTAGLVILMPLASPGQ